MKPLASNYSSVYYYGLAWSLNLDLTIGESWPCVCLVLTFFSMAEGNQPATPI